VRIFTKWVSAREIREPQGFRGAETLTDG
jgi:hypothetical protein